MRTFLTIASSIALWVLVVTKFNAMWRRRHESDHGPLVSRVWLTAVFLGTSLLLLVDDIQLAVGQAVGMNNFAWYLSYLAGSIAFQQVGYLSVRQYRPIGRKARLLFAVPLVLLLIAFSVLYFGWLRWTPEWPARSPRAWDDALFMVLFFGYAGSAGIIPILIQSIDYRQRPAQIVRLRTGLRILTALLANVCFWLKVAYTIAAYRTPGSPFAEQLNQLALLSMGASAVFFSIQLASHKTFVRMVDFLQIPKKMAALDDLHFIQSRLLRFCPPVVSVESTWWEQLRNPDRYLYMAVISILDSHKMLNGYLTRLEERHETRLVINTDSETIYWNQAEIAQARQLCQLLQSPPEGGLEELVAFYRQVAQHLRQQGGRLAASPLGSHRLHKESQAGAVQDPDMTAHPV